MKTLIMKVDIDVSDYSDAMIEAVKAYALASMAPATAQGIKVDFEIEESRPPTPLIDRLLRGIRDEHNSELSTDQKRFLDRWLSDDTAKR